MQNISKS